MSVQDAGFAKGVDRGLTFPSNAARRCSRFRRNVDRKNGYRADTPFWMLMACFDSPTLARDAIA